MLYMKHTWEVFSFIYLIYKSMNHLKYLVENEDYYVQIEKYGDETEVNLSNQHIQYLKEMLSSYYRVELIDIPAPPKDLDSKRKTSIIILQAYDLLTDVVPTNDPVKPEKKSISTKLKRFMGYITEIRGGGDVCDFNISELEDEYFRVSLNKDTRGYRTDAVYKCDQIDGVKELLKNKGYILRRASSSFF